MQHPDQGTIHAWLDGALDANESRALEAHVATCGECQALVAEARGLVAAASRIVGQLDGVPHDVLPLAVVPRSVAAPKPARVTRWRYVGLAAAAVLGVTTTTWLARDRGSVRDPQVEQTRDVASAPTIAQPQAIASATSSPPAADAVVKARRLTVRESAASASRVAVAAQAAAPPASTLQSTAPSTPTTTSAIAAGGATPAVAAPRALPVAAPLAAATTPPASPAPMPLLGEPRRARTMADERAVESTTNGDASLIGCYRLLSVTQGSGGSATVNSASAKSTMSPLLRLTDSTTRTADRSPVADSRRTEPRDASSQAFIAFTSGLGAAPSVRWRTIGSGLIRLDRDDGSSVLIRLAADTSRATGRVDRVDYTATRISCP